jgi:hypothetical protein
MCIYFRDFFNQKMRNAKEITNKLNLTQKFLINLSHIQFSELTMF